jgi:minor extracellular protease Epr
MSDLVHLPPYRVEFTTSALSNADGVDWGVSQYGIPALWQKSQGAGVTVAVIDSGVAKHSSLEIADWRNFSSDSSVEDTLGHGTHVAGIIGARSGLSKGIAPQCNILSLKVLGHSGMGSISAVTEAILHAVDAKADIVCMSLGSSKPDSGLHEAIKHAYTNGVIVVCAAGNDGGAVNYPAAFAETIGVGAVDRTGAACEFSSRGKEIVVAAPGADITSTWLANGYATVSGTSMAAPFVAGTLALWLGAGGKGADHSAVLKALSSTCRDVGDSGRDSVYGWGLLDPHKLMNYSATPAGVTIFIPGAKIL